MKKAVLILITLFWAGFILSASLGKTNLNTTVYAAAKLKFTVPAPTATPTVKPKVNYFLVYPGILPDSPLYKLKMVRDRVWLWLTTEPLKLAELKLLYADKRIGAGSVLIEGNKVALGIETIVKGEKYFEQAIVVASKAKSQGVDIAKMKERLQTASLKYEEVLTDLDKKIDHQGTPPLTQIIEKIISQRKIINQL